jgi:hypothetical protein
MKHVVCYSGGHESAIAAIETVEKYGYKDVILLNHDICERSEDPDIKRFKREVADYVNVPITYANMSRWWQKDQFDVCMELEAFKFGIQSSALCTREIKTKPFENWLSKNFPSKPFEVRDDVEIIYGFGRNEGTRITRRVGVMLSKGYKTDYPLLWEHRTIHDTEEAGIKRPRTYEIFNHANCKGCLKAGKQHWFVVYCLYPEVWEKAKRAEEKIGYSILREKFLKDYEEEFKFLNESNLTATEKINPQKFWATARKLIKGDDNLPCECAV